MIIHLARHNLQTLKWVSQPRILIYEGALDAALLLEASS